MTFRLYVAAFAALLVAAGLLLAAAADALRSLTMLRISAIASVAAIVLALRTLAEVRRAP